ncbi:MAG: DNA methyltransferase [Anaerolineales bacterium]
MRQMALVELAAHRNGEVSLAIDSDFPEEFANQLSRREAYNKHLFRPNTYLHKWWARRCGSTFRAILKQFVSHPEQRDYYAPRGLEGKIVLDPMMGGGTTLHEAIRLGANVIGADIDPIPVVQIRASLAQISLQELQATFEGFFQDLHSNVGSYFKTECPRCDVTLDAQYTLHGLRKRCACGEVIQIDSFELRYETDRVIRICPDDLSIVEDACQEAGSQNHRRLILKSETSCAQCGQKYQELLDIPYFARYIPIAVVGACPQHGLFFKQPDERDHRRIVEADQHRSKLDFGPLEEFRVESGPKSGDLLRRNVRKYSEVFSSRQLLYLWHAIQLLQCYEGAARINCVVDP